MSPMSVLFVLLCAQAAWASVHNVTSPPLDLPVTSPPLDLPVTSPPVDLPVTSPPVDLPVTSPPADLPPRGRTFLMRRKQTIVPQTVIEPFQTIIEPFPDPDDDAEDPEDLEGPVLYSTNLLNTNAIVSSAEVEVEVEVVPARTNASRGPASRVPSVNSVPNNTSVPPEEPLFSEEARRFLTSPLSTVLMPSFYALVCAVSVPLNAVAVLAFARGARGSRRPLKPAVVYMLNLATADLLFAATLPFKMAYHFNGNDWVFGPAMCRIVTAAFYCNMYCSVLLITCIAVDRLLAVVYPIDSLVWRRPRYAVAACALMWALALGGSVPLVIKEQTMHIPDMDITTCHDVQDDEGDLRNFYMIYFSVLCCCLFLLPLVVTAVCYTRVIWTLSRIPHGVTGQSRRKARAVVMALTVLVLFVACFTPTNILLLVHYLQMGGAHNVPDGSYAVYLVFVCVGSASCCLDPLVYYFGSSQCQRQLAAALGCRASSSGDKSGTHSSSESSRSTSRTIFKSSLLKSSSAKQKDSSSANEDLKSQYKKLLL